VVRVPSVDEEDAKRLHRERKRLIQERVQHVNRIKGLCALHGIYDYQPLSADRKAQLEGLRISDGRPLPPRLKLEIRRELQRLELVLRMISEVEAERDDIQLLAVQPPSNARHLPSPAMGRLAVQRSLEPAAGVRACESGPEARPAALGGGSTTCSRCHAGVVGSLLSL
jgi:transposase